MRRVIPFFIIAAIIILIIFLAMKQRDDSSNSLPEFIQRGLENAQPPQSSGEIQIIKPDVSQEEIDKLQQHIQHQYDGQKGKSISLDAARQSQQKNDAEKPQTTP